MLQIHRRHSFQHKRKRLENPFLIGNIIVVAVFVVVVVAVAIVVAVVIIIVTASNILLWK